MVAAKLDLTDDRIIEEGSFWSLEIRHPGNIVGSTVRGDIKKGYNQEKLASFRFLPIEFDPEINKSIIVLYLTAADTKRIAVPPQHWVYDVLLITPGAVDSPVRMLQGKVYVSEGVTDA